MFLGRSDNSWTKRLFKLALKSDSKNQNNDGETVIIEEDILDDHIDFQDNSTLEFEDHVEMRIDGPYGDIGFNPGLFDRFVFVAGGIGSKTNFLFLFLFFYYLIYFFIFYFLFFIFYFY